MQMEIKNDDSGARKGNRHNQVKLKKQKFVFTIFSYSLVGSFGSLIF